MTKEAVQNPPKSKSSNAPATEEQIRKSWQNYYLRKIGSWIGPNEMQVAKRSNNKRQVPNEEGDDSSKKPRRQ